MDDELERPFDPDRVQEPYTVKQLIQELLEFPSDAKIMIAVVKYPEEFRVVNGRWTDNDTVECHLLEENEVNLIDGIVHLSCELMDYSEQRHLAGG